MNWIELLKLRVLSGEPINKAEAVQLIEEPLHVLCQAANEIRAHFCGNTFDVCTIINAKSGKCSENCKYCAQSSHYHTQAEQYPMLTEEEIVRKAQYDHDHGVLRYSLVISGRKPSEREIKELCHAISAVKTRVGIPVCGSMGLVDREQCDRLREAGLTRVHNNLESSRRNFPNVCTTHTYDDKIASLKAAQEAGLSVCSGGIMGLGETMEDRIDMALDLRELGVRSVPVNMLAPIAGTPYEKNKVLTNDEMCRIVAIYRFILPNASIRLAGGRGLLKDKGKKCFQSGANAVITGDMLTTAGYTIESDMEMIAELGFKPELWNA